MASSYSDTTGTDGCRVTTVIAGNEVRVTTRCPVRPTVQATYERDYESTMPMVKFAEAARRMAMNDHKEEHSG